MNPDIARLQRQARELLPPAVYDYYAGGSGRERTLRANERSWRRNWLAPRVLRDVRAVDTTTRLLGAGLRTPVAVAPTAYQRLAHPEGELATAAGAARAGALLVLSTRSTRRLEDVAAQVGRAGGTWWLQVYVMRDRDRTIDLVRRAAAAGAQALVLTADTPVVGRKHRDTSAMELIAADMLANLGPVQDPADLHQSAGVTFADIAWLSEVSGGLPVVVKGVLRPDDALACAAAGAAAVIVSNHGGRQLDGALPAAWALPGVAAALAQAPGQVPVYVDGGIRTGEDVLAAIALGAQAVFVGRPVLWALACGGADGVADLLSGLTDALAHAMALAGAPSLPQVAGIAGITGVAGVAGVAGITGQPPG
ncbi:MAG TPA: alpha-hydroxy acid oxidase [Streptosporangiaceae bacterium]|nr:alpha-hydroxy acid oxidase [Streptosporangiaceae bacterium]